MTGGDDANEIFQADAARTLAKAVRVMFNELLLEGFTEQQALLLVRSWIHGMSGGSSP